MGTEVNISIEKESTVDESKLKTGWYRAKYAHNWRRIIHINDTTDTAFVLSEGSDAVQKYTITSAIELYTNWVTLKRLTIEAE